MNWETTSAARTAKTPNHHKQAHGKKLPTKGRPAPRTDHCSNNSPRSLLSLLLFLRRPGRANGICHHPPDPPPPRAGTMDGRRRPLGCARQSWRLHTVAAAILMLCVAAEAAQPSESMHCRTISQPNQPDGCCNCNILCDCCCARCTRATKALEVAYCPPITPMMHLDCRGWLGD